MKIGVLTCHDVYNYGATLQAYALCKYLNAEIGQTELINYKPKYLYRLINLMEVDAPKWKKNLFTRWCYRIYILPHKLKWVKKYVRYKIFNMKYLKISSPVIENNEDLKHKKQWDICICGSDQIWNSSTYPLGEDMAYYLGFQDGVKVAYAASFGGRSVSELGKHNIKEYIPSFKAVSVREKSAIDILKQYDVNAVHVVDPVFLVSQSEWKRIEKMPKHIPEKYILAYGYDNSVEFVEAVKAYANISGLPIISYDTKLFRDAGPREFLALIQNASMVITTSFHATAFSIIMHTPFVVAKTQKEDLFERIDNILDMSGLKDRTYSEVKKSEDWSMKEIDFIKADNCMKEYIEKSKQFLKVLVDIDD